jgi:hypothetical protein
MNFSIIIAFLFFFSGIKAATDSVLDTIITIQSKDSDNECTRAIAQSLEHKCGKDMTFEQAERLAISMSNCYLQKKSQSSQVYHCTDNKKVQECELKMPEEGKKILAAIRNKIMAPCHFVVARTAVPSFDTEKALPELADSLALELETIIAAQPFKVSGQAGSIGTKVEVLVGLPFKLAEMADDFFGGVPPSVLVIYGILAVTIVLLTHGASGFSQGVLILLIVVNIYVEAFVCKGLAKIPWVDNMLRNEAGFNVLLILERFAFSLIIAYKTYRAMQSEKRTEYQLSAETMAGMLSLLKNGNGKNEDKKMDEKTEEKSK